MLVATLPVQGRTPCGRDVRFSRNWGVRHAGSEEGNERRHGKSGPFAVNQRMSLRLWRSRTTKHNATKHNVDGGNHDEVTLRTTLRLDGSCEDCRGRLRSRPEGRT